MPARPRGGLGRGLDALIPQAESPSASSVPIDQVSSNPYQPRSSMDADQLESLADSIREHGVLQPLLVQSVPGGYRLIAGHRRLEAARLAGLATVPVIVRESERDENSLLLALVENLQREDLSPIDEATAYRELSRRFGFSTEEIARRTGRSRSAVANSMRLLDLAPEVREMLEAGRLTEGHARALLALREKPRQVAAAHAVVERGLNVRQTEALVRRLLSGRVETRPARADAELKALEQRFRDVLGTKVSFSGTTRSGRITIHYYSEEELQALYDAVVGEG